MTEYILSFKPAIKFFGAHDPSAALFRNGKLVFGVEEERFTRRKHSMNDFPVNSIQACLKSENIEMNDIDKIVLPYQPSLWKKNLTNEMKGALDSKGVFSKLYNIEGVAKGQAIRSLKPFFGVRRRLHENFEGKIPEIVAESHHKCHAASAHYSSGFENSLVLTLDGKGEYDSTVVWKGKKNSIERIKTFEYPNSLGHFYGAVTEYLGYRAFNGEGKIMGLAPYGSYNKDIIEKLEERVDVVADYDVTEITENGIEGGVKVLEDLFDRERSKSEEFDQWQKDLAYCTQHVLERIVEELTEKYIEKTGIDKVTLAGGVALNCKMNKKLMENENVEELFIQPVAHDAGLAIGGGLIHSEDSGFEMNNVYWGPSYSSQEIREMLEESKISYSRPEDLEDFVAEKLVEGKLVGWFQGSLEMGPRALGNRSILADPRTEESRDRVNQYVKHREEWRPFAPSMLEESVEEYLENGESAPYMIKTFDVKEEKIQDMEAVLHPGDDTTRPQTVNEKQNPRYYNLIKRFEEKTGVPLVLNTSFNDHAEPIVNTPKEALKDFFGMGLDVLVLEDYVIEK